MTTDSVYIDADDLITYGVAVRFLCWLTDLLMRSGYDDESEAA